ncbi:hypothetical protein [Leifsonia sp. A12D58]|uniref:hypothetical protein n=1 Tax=Leifsonia sp. A12D58 TaxID=3397674 RepID=UPI0039DFE82F
MMSFLRKDDFEPEKKKGDGSGDGEKKGPSMNRIAIWVVVGAVGLYMLGSGLIGILGK